MSKIIETKRLILRTWNDRDLLPMAAINQDPKVMEYFPALQDLDKTRLMVKKLKAHFIKYGYTFYATENKDNGDFIGFIGLFTPEFQSHFTPTTEIGWRLSSNYWEQGIGH